MVDGVSAMFKNMLNFTTFIKVYQEKSHVEASVFIGSYNNFEIT